MTDQTGITRLATGYGQGPTVTREAPWVGIGVKGHWTDYRDALNAAQLGFTVEQKEMFWQKDVLPNKFTPGIFNATVTVNEPTPMMANVRSDTQEALGYVTTQYGIIQNEDAFALLEPFTRVGGVITNAGMTEQGLCFMVLRMQQTKFLGDYYDFDVMCCNSFNTKFPLSLIMVPTRIICQNMYRKLMGNNDSILHLRHASHADNRLKAANAAVNAIDSYVTAFGLSVEKAADKYMDSTEYTKLVELLFPYPKPGNPREQMTKDKVDKMRVEFYDRYYMAPDNVKFHRTGMGFLNAYYDFLSHRDPGKNMPGSWEDRRLSSLVSGSSIKPKIIQACM